MKKGLVVPAAIGVGVISLLAMGAYMYKRAAAKVNDVALSSDAKPVTVSVARATTFRPTHRYVATVSPWLLAKVGPQLVSAYVDTVLFRPGAIVKKGDVLATLDCRNASAESQAVAMMARALETKQAAVAKEAARVTGLLDGGFVSQNEADKKLAESSTQAAEILAAKAKLLGSSLEVNDCILKAPFDGEVSDRSIDPGAFVRPGISILTLVDRGTVRVSADVPETDFGIVPPNTNVAIRLLATGKSISAPITRRAPSADPSTRTVHFEIDLADATRSIPVGTTAELVVEFGDPIRAAQLPLKALSIRGDKATVFVVEGDHVKKRSFAVLGESGGNAFLDPALEGAQVVTEGRALLEDGDRVKALAVTTASSGTSASP